MKLALLGCGVVGGGVLEIAEKRPDMSVKYVLVRRDRPELGDKAVKDIDIILSDPEVEVVVEVLGGLSPSFEYVSAALKAGKSVVTANKHLVAHYYNELVSLARENGAAFRCTPAVGGGIPWLVNLERVKKLDSVKSFCGIMNGTTNFILDAMHKDSADFAEVLKKAQELGYAEADPSADIDGLDIQRKAVISANVAFDCCITEADVPVFGIRSVKACDIAAAASAERVCKMLAFGEASDSGAVSCWVEPCFVPSGELEAAVAKNRNVISFETELTGKESFYGQGAGRYPTAYNAVADCLDIANGVKSFYSDEMKPAEVDNSLPQRPYYVRSAVKDYYIESIKEYSLGEGIVTMPVSVSAMHEWAEKTKALDPELFIAGLV